MSYGSATPAGEEFWDQLDGRKKMALNESHFTGSRLNIGKLSVGSITACWHGEDDELVFLRDQGLRLDREFPLFGGLTLDIYATEEAGTLATHYRVDDNACLIDASHFIIDGYFSAKKLTKARVASWWYDRKHTFHTATDEERTKLFAEVTRGATGLYAFRR